MEHDERMRELEAKAMYQERAIAELSELVAEHEGRVRRLEDALRKVVERIKDMSDDQSSGPMPHERPPHY